MAVIKGKSVGPPPADRELHVDAASSKRFVKLRAVHPVSGRGWAIIVDGNRLAQELAKLGYKA